MTLLKLHSEGPAVAALIADLIALRFSLEPGAMFTLDVKRCVEAFQSANIDSLGRPLKVDGKVGEHTRWALDAALGKVTVPNFAPSPLGGIPGGGSAAGRAALEVAIAEMAAGHGEVGGDNLGPHVQRYLAPGGGGPPQSWCAGFVSWCFREALGHSPVFGYLIGAQAIHNRMKALGLAYTATISNPPQPGDIIVWRRFDPENPKSAPWHGHVGIVHGFENGYLAVIEGNKGAFPSKVGIFRYSWTDLVISETNDKFKGLFGVSRHP